MSVTITLIERDYKPKHIVLDRIPCIHEDIILAGMEYHITSVRHIADLIPASAEVRVTRFGKGEPE
jgi:hypothetical protein